jgi:hypothetical protein
MRKKPVDRTVAEATDRPAAYRKSSKRTNSGNRREKSSGENSASQAEPSHEKVAAIAYDIWEREGRPEGQEESHWLEAERLLRALN